MKRADIVFLSVAMFSSAGALEPDAPPKIDPSVPLPGTSERQTLLDIRRAVQRAPAPAGPARIQNLRVFRMDGKVVLTGTARTQQEKDAAGASAAAVVVGHQVDNRIIVK